MAEQPRAKFDIDAVGGVGKHIGAQDAQNGLEHRDRHEADYQHVEGAKAAMHQHLVDDDLEEQRRNQREQLQKERRDQHLADDMAIFVDGAEKPGDVEAARQVQEPDPARHQNEFAVPHCFKLGPRHQSGPRLRR